MQLTDWPLVEVNEVTLLLIGLTHIFFDTNQLSGSQGGLQKRVFKLQSAKVLSS
jgi:hypothetical protein